jgi:hypothetical protein
MSRVRKISLAEQALWAIQESEFIKALSATKRVGDELNNTDSIEQSFDDREETINDYMFNCGYTRKEAINAYNQILEYER